MMGGWRCGCSGLPSIFFCSRLRSLSLPTCYYYYYYYYYYYNHYHCLLFTPTITTATITTATITITTATIIMSLLPYYCCTIYCFQVTVSLTRSVLFFTYCARVPFFAFLYCRLVIHPSSLSSVSISRVPVLIQ